VPIHRAKSVEELYEDCRNYDLVLVPDPPLASALNRRLEQAHFGPFAITPRRLAAGRRETAEDRIAFLEVIEETDLSWKEAAFAIGNVLQCWDNRGEPEAILEYEAFDTPETRAVLSVIGELDTTSSRLAEYDIFDTVVLTDIIEDKPAGLALDMNQSRTVWGLETTVVGATTGQNGEGYEVIGGSNVVVSTDGLPRKPGMRRMSVLGVRSKRTA
jgi:hypothetical protein